MVAGVAVVISQRKARGQQVSVADRARLSWDSYQRCVTDWATKPGLQVAAAAGYLRAVMERADPAVAQRFADEAVDRLVAAGQELDEHTVGTEDHQP